MYRKFTKSGSRSSSACNALTFFSRILRSEAFVYNSYFFRPAVLRKIIDIRFSYKHCKFSRVCLLVKMPSKTVTRYILFCFFFCKATKLKYGGIRNILDKTSTLALINQKHSLQIPLVVHYLVFNTSRGPALLVSLGRVC